eukprot:1842724-Pyramimonas_sp.AAC.1
MIDPDTCPALDRDQFMWVISGCCMKYNRRLTFKEMLMLQGVDPKLTHNLADDAASAIADTIAIPSFGVVFACLFSDFCPSA